MPDGGVGRILAIPQKKNIAVMIFRDNCKPLRVTPHHVWGQSLRLCGVKASASASTSPRSLEPREADNGGGSVTIHVSVVYKASTSSAAIGIDTVEAAVGPERLL